MRYREMASQMYRIKRRLAESMTNQPRLVNMVFVTLDENEAKSVVSTIPRIATAPVKASAMRSRGFLNIISPSL
jgi:hypothetical protein